MRIQDKRPSVNFTLDDNGYLVTTAKLARIGAMQYGGEELDKKDNKLYDVYVEAHDLFSPETMKSFEGMPVTIDHPIEMYVDSSNWRDLSVGHISNIRKDASGEFLLGDVIVNEPNAIKHIQSGNVEVSCGYDADIENINGKLKKINIKGNHLAIVKEGRCGDKCKLGDGKPIMKKKTTFSDSVRKAFGLKPRQNQKSFNDFKRVLNDAKKKLNDAKAHFTAKLKDAEEIVQSDAPLEEKAAAVQDLQVEADNLMEKATAAVEEAQQATQQAEQIASQIEEDAPKETVTDAEITQAAQDMDDKIADLEAQVQEKDDKIAELEAQLEALKEQEDKITTANDAKRVFGDKLVLKDSMTSTDIKRAVVVNTGAYDAKTVKTLNDCALNSAYSAALTVNAKTKNIGKKLLGDSNPQAKQLPKALRGNK